MKLRLAALVATTTLAGCAVDDHVLASLAPDAATAAPDPTPAPPDAPPPPDAAPPAPPDATLDASPADAGPVLVPGIGLRHAPPAPTSCGHRDDTPILPEEAANRAAKRLVASLELEENGGLDPRRVLTDRDTTELGAAGAATPRLTLLDDADGDCLSDSAEARAGTDPADPDSDGDGWFDGPCNERRRLVLTRVHAHDEQEDIGDDELYLVADDIRHPQPDLDGVWDFDDGQSMATAWTLATRVRGTARDAALALVRVEGWEDDFEIIGDWTVDDLLFDLSVDLAAFRDGATFTRRLSGDDDYDYELGFRVDVERFADPDPRADGDGDGDGIRESAEARIAHELGGIADPARSEVFVEVDWMAGHPLRTQAKRMISTQLHRNGIHLVLHRDEELPTDGCLTVPETRALYAERFGRKGYGAFRYAVIGEQLWNDRSGVAWGDIFLVDDSTWWINNWILPQAGTFIHELGHTLGLTNDVFPLIDSVAWFSYDSAMNYLYQATKVDFSSDGAGGDSGDHDDWAAVKAGHALRWSFALTTSKEAGSCR